LQNNTELAVSVPVCVELPDLSESLPECWQRSEYATSVVSRCFQVDYSREIHGRASDFRNTWTPLFEERFRKL